MLINEVSNLLTTVASTSVETAVTAISIKKLYDDLASPMLKKQVK